MFRRSRSACPTVRSACARRAAAALLLCTSFAPQAQVAEAPGAAQPALQRAPSISATPGPETTDPQPSGPQPSAAMPSTVGPGPSEALRVPAPGVRQRAPAPPVETEADRLAVAVAGFRQEIADLQNVNHELAGTNQHLNELNGQLRQEVESLALELQEVRAATDQRRMLYGAGLILFGLLAGVLIKARPRRSAWS